MNPELNTKYISLPLINHKSEKIAFRLKNLENESFRKINLRVAFKSPAQLGDHFDIKDKVTGSKNSNVGIIHVFYY